LFWENLTKFLMEELGFTMNPYDQCMVNKIIKGKKARGCTNRRKQQLYKSKQRTALLFWENLTKFLMEELGFTVNPYDQCMVNKIIKGKQCTIIWHVDNLKLSHVRQSVLEDIACQEAECKVWAKGATCYTPWKNSRIPQHDN
jgi:hypothetical protein